jgi:very-short-patch-repair endonuclease
VAKSDLEEAFLAYWDEYAKAGGPPEREYRFAPPRRFRLDFAWVEKRVGVEITGGIWTQGRHSRGGPAQINEIDKRNLLASTGWTLLEFSEQHLRTDPLACVGMVEAVLEGRGTDGNH